MEDTAKRASWIELFYDVAYIALVAQLTYLAATHHHSVEDFFNIFLIGYSIFIAWWITTANRNLQPNESSGDKLFIQLQMVGAFCMSLTMGGVFEGSYLPFFLTLGLVRLLQTLMMLRMYYLYPHTRPVTYNIFTGFTISSFLWLSSAFVPNPFHFALALSALLVDIFVPQTRGKGNTKRYLNVYHLQERLGLFLMLVIGESMIVVALSNTFGVLTPASATVIFSGLGLMLAVWWLYFEHSDEHAGQRPNNLFLFLHSHGFLFGSVILVSAAYKLILEAGEPKTSLAFLLSGAVGISVSIMLIRSTLHKLCLVSAFKTSVLLFIAGLVSVVGITRELVYETVVSVTLLFLLAALLDHLNFFRDSKKGSC
jgi:low temperature requirement protein LtrA